MRKKKPAPVAQHNNLVPIDYVAQAVIPLAAVAVMGLFFWSMHINLMDSIYKTMEETPKLLSWRDFLPL